MGRPDRSTFHTRLKRMTSELRNRILTGGYAQGDYLPSELALTEQYELSKNSVRFGLDQLVAEGLIVKIPRVGTQVAVKQEKKVKLRFGVYPSMHTETEIDKYMAMFHEKYPHILVETVELSYTSADSIKNLVALGIVDVLTLNLFNLFQMDESESLHLFQKQLPKEAIYPFLTEQFTLGAGQLVAQPFVFSPVILCYNKEHLRERRLFEPDSSWSWDDLYKMLRKLKAPNRYGMAFHLFSFNRWMLYLLQNNTRFVRGKDGSVSLAGQDGFAPLKKLRDIIHEDGLFPIALSHGEVEAEVLFKEQKVSVILTTYYMLNHLKDAAFAYDIAQLPAHCNNETLLLATGIAINAQAKHKEAAHSLVDFLTSDEIQAQLRMKTFSLPANKYIAETVEVQLPGKPSRIELHRELIPKYTTYRSLQLSMDEIIAAGDCLKQYFSHLIDEQGIMALLNEKLQHLRE